MRPEDDYSWWEKLAHASCLLTIPWIQLLFNRNLFVTPGGNIYIDPWLYTGFFLDLPGMMRRFPDTYYASRLSWLLPGYVLHKAFPPMVANAAVHLAFFYFLIFAAYLLVASGVGRRTALLVALVVGFSPIVLAAVSWDYVDGAGITFITGTLMCLEKAIQAERGRWLWSIAAGALAVCMASSNLFLGVYWPLCGLFVMLRAGFRRWHGIAAITAGAAIGAALATLAFAYVNTRLGGQWWFLGPQLRMGQSLVDAPNPWKLPGYAWVAHATWLVVPLIATIGALLSLLPRLRLASPFARVMQVLLLVGVATWIAVHAWGTPVLQISYYSSYLAPLALIALPLQFLPSEGELGRRRFAASLAVSLAILVIVQWLIVSDVPGFWVAFQRWLNGGSTVVPPDGALWFTAPFPTTSALGAAVTILLVARLVRQPQARVVLFVAGVSVASTVAPPDLPSKAMWYTKPYYQATAEAHRFIEQVVGDRSFRIWSTDPRGTKRPIISIASTFLWGPSLVNYLLPSLPKEDAARLAQVKTLVFLVPKAGDVELAREPLRQAGLEYDLIAQRNFGSGELELAVVIANLR